MADPAQRIDDCRDLYIKYGGRRHELIEREMREKGHTRFRRRIMYTRRERGRICPGWIERYGWRRKIDAETPRRRNAGKIDVGTERRSDAGMSEPGAVATGFRSRLTKIKFNRQKARRLRKMQDAARARHRDAGILVPASLRPALSPSPTDDFHAWLKRQPGMWNWDWRHQLYVYEHLKRVTEGDCRRLMIFMPPRHGKSELVTVRYSAWRLQQDPSLNVILGCYNQRLANRFSRKVRRVIADGEAVSRGVEEERSERVEESKREGGVSAGTTVRSSAPPHLHSSTPDSPFPFIRQRPANSVAEWETTMGGGMRAVGVGGGVTGFGAKLIIIDDPVKSRAEAESPKMREKVWDWFNDDIYTRLEPNGAIVLIQTRWHEDDLAGRLLKEMENGGEQWEVVNLPALAEDWSAGIPACNAGSSGGPNAMNDAYEDDQGAAGRCRVHAGKVPQAPVADPLGRVRGEALCPDRFDVPALENLQRRLGTYSFSALYQQRPTPAEGMIFKREWFTKVVKHPPPDLKWTRGYDLAVSTKTTADYTASFRVAYDADGNLYIDGGFRKRVEFPDQRRYILGRIAAELDTEHGIELALHGQGIMQDLRRQARLQGRRFRGVQVEGDKLTRALKWSSLAEEGKVFLVRGGWNADFIDEACSFPGGQFDDQIDAVSIAVRMHEKQAGRLIRF